jgi:hypothetical protein
MRISLANPRAKTTGADLRLIFKLRQIVGRNVDAKKVVLEFHFAADKPTIARWVHRVK